MGTEISSTSVNPKVGSHPAQGKTISTTDSNAEEAGEFPALMMKLESDPSEAKALSQDDNSQPAALVPGAGDASDIKLVHGEQSMREHQLLLLQSTQRMQGALEEGGRAGMKQGATSALRVLHAEEQEKSGEDVDLTQVGIRSLVPEPSKEGGQHHRLAALELKPSLVPDEAAVLQKEAVREAAKETMREVSVNAINGLTEKTENKMSARFEFGVLGQNFQTTAAPGDVYASHKSGGVMTPEKMGSQEMNYWVGREVQFAELKLDGPGNKPVEVSVSVRGNEASVEFRTEPFETRQIIEDSMPHLKELLRNEGLVLSSVSVGSTSADASSSQDRKPKQNQRRAIATLSGMRVANEGPRGAPLAGSSVDLFV